MMIIKSTFSVFLLLFLAASLADEATYCDFDALYEDISCKGVIKDGEKCPYKYECPEFKSQEGFCHFRGRTLAVGEYLGNDEGCKVTCRCSESSKIRCATLECPEQVFGYKPIPGCRWAYEVGKCCQAGEICRDDSENCTVGEKTYKEGEQFDVEGTCLRCVCKEGFVGKLTKEFCEKSKCHVELGNSQKLENKCAALYILREGDPLCCPSRWLCPTGDEDIKKVNTEVKDEGLECQFGSKTLKLGEGFETSFNPTGETIEVKCECRVPPIVTCIIN